MSEVESDRNVRIRLYVLLAGLSSAGSALIAFLTDDIQFGLVALSLAVMLAITEAYLKNHWQKQGDTA